MVSQVGFERLNHLIRIPLGLPDGSSGRFLVDTGIGISVVSSGFAARHQLAELGRNYVGTRMAGDTVTAPLVRLPAFSLGGEILDGRVAAVADLGASDGDDGFDGILGLDLLGDLPLTIDPARALVTVGARPAEGTRIPVVLKRDVESVCLFVDLRLPDGKVVQAEIDTGSASTILSTRFVTSCGVDLESPDVRTVSPTNETGAVVQRWFVPVPGPLALDAAPETAQRGATVMFQDITFDALVGTDFLDRYVQTYDTSEAALTLVPVQ